VKKAVLLPLLLLTMMPRLVEPLVVADLVATTTGHVRRRPRRC
jgi:hypothetical protein